MPLLWAANQALDLTAAKMYPEDSFWLNGELITDIATVNNSYGHDAVLEVFDKVLADETVV